MTIRHTPELSNSVPLSSLQRYLILHDWSRDEHIRKGFDLFYITQRRNSKIDLLLPRDNSAIDANRRISDALHTLAQFEGRELDQVIADVKAVGVDIWKAVVPDALVRYEAVKLSVAEEFIKNARGLLAAAATTENAPKPFFARVSKAGQNFAEECRFGHTFRGSFGFTIESPIVPNLSPTIPGVEEQAPLERRAMERIARGISNIVQAGHEDNTSAILDNYHRGFSANMCEDFVELMGAVSGQKLEFEFSFSPEWRPAAGIKTKITAEIAPIHVELAKEAARTLRLRDFERHQTVVGRVVRLEAELNPSDLFEQGDREIAVHWLSKDFGDIRVRLSLPPDQYLAAVEAHGRGRVVTVTGEIDRQGRSWYLREPENFKVIG